MRQKHFRTGLIKDVLLFPATRWVKCLRRDLLLALAFMLLQFALPRQVFAVCDPGVQSCSSNYSTDQTFFGSGGELNACSSGSAGYCASQSAGSLGVGNGSSANYRSVAGFLTPNQPYLELHVNAATISLGVLSSSSAATGSGTFSVRTYLSGSYAVYTMSDPLTSEGGAVLKPITSAAFSAPGTEQFGINLVANTSPTALGANPVNIPDNTFADGQAAPGYNTTNKYQYNKGDVIASSAKTAGNQAVGETDYTISYIANIAYLTKAGFYTMNHDIVAVATY